MDADSQRPEWRDGLFSSLAVAIEALNLLKEISSVTPAKAVFGSVSVLLTMIKDTMANKTDYVELGLACADVCKALDRGTSGRRLDELSRSVREAIAQLTTTVAEIQKKVTEKSGRNVVSRVFHAKSDKEAIAGWKLDLNRILHIFNTELAINTHMMVSDLHRNALTGADGQYSSAHASIPPGELPPPPLRDCFGRDDLIEKLVGLAEDLTPIALIGPGGIGKTSIALAVLHHDRIRQRFGCDRRFIRCDQFPASRANFLGRLSKVIGAGVENPEDLIPLRPFLSSRQMILILDNVESVLDSQGTTAQEIYAMVEELSQFNNICLCITSRTSIIPPDCKRLDVPTLSIDAARRTFYRIYDSDERSNMVDNILRQLDFHPLSITLLATVAHHNKWGIDRLTREWEGRRTGVLHAQHNKSLAATIELSLASPTFQGLGPDARDLLGVVAFFPQGIDENNLEWLFPNIPERTNIFDKFCTLSLAYRSNEFITMLAPLRDHLCPKDPTSSPLLCMAKDCYFRRLSLGVHPGNGYEEAQWITPEDVNVEHLLNVFTSIDVDSVDVWAACRNFIEHLYQHKPRPVVLGPKIERLPDDHPSKPECLSALSRLLHSVGNFAEVNRLLVYTLKFWREQGDDPKVAWTLLNLAESNRWLGLQEEAVQQANEGSELYKRLNDTLGQARSLRFLALLFWDDNQLDAAEEGVSKAIDLLPDKGEEYEVCQCHHVLGKIYLAKGETEKAIEHYNAALEIASSLNRHRDQFRIHYSLARLFFGQNRFDDAENHIKCIKSRAVDNPYGLGCAMRLQGRYWYNQRRLEEAKSEALGATDVFEKIGSTRDVQLCRDLLQDIETEMESSGYQTSSHGSTQTCPSVDH